MTALHISRKTGGSINPDDPEDACAIASTVAVEATWKIAAMMAEMVMKAKPPTPEHAIGIQLACESLRDAFLEGAAGAKEILDDMEARVSA